MRTMASQSIEFRSPSVRGRKAWLAGGAGVAALLITGTAQAADDPAHDYGGLKADGLAPGQDSEQWLYNDRNTAVLGGCSTTEVRDGVLTIGDVVTFYRPTGDTLPPYRHVVDIVKLANALYNFDLEFKRDEWDGAPVIPDDQPTVNPSAKRPKDFKAAAGGVVDSLAAAAILSDPATTKKNIAVEIDPANPKRVNMSVPVKIAGNNNVTSLDINWGFQFGTLTGG